jgi:hypothetical protein
LPDVLKLRASVSDLKILLGRDPKKEYKDSVAEVTFE